jgi:hypothetical protein
MQLLVWDPLSTPAFRHLARRDDCGVGQRWRDGPQNPGHHVRQSPDRQPRRHRLPHHPHLEGSWASAASPCTPRPTPLRPPCARSRRGLLHRPGPGGRELPARRHHPRDRPRNAAPRPSTPATASSPRTPPFAEACEAAGIAFIGPTAAQMRAFGLKHTARELAEQPTACRCCPAAACSPMCGHARLEAAHRLPGDAEEHRRRRRHRHAPDAQRRGRTGRGLRLGERLASANFKEAGIYLEKYVERARHIEVQVFGDGLGACWPWASATARCSAATRR